MAFSLARVLGWRCVARLAGRAAARAVGVAQALLAQQAFQVVASLDGLFTLRVGVAAARHAAALPRRDRAAGDRAVAGSGAVAAHARRRVAAAGVGGLRGCSGGQRDKGCRRNETESVHVHLWWKQVSNFDAKFRSCRTTRK